MLVSEFILSVDDDDIDFKGFGIVQENNDDIFLLFDLLESFFLE